MIEIKNVSKRFGEISVIENLNMVIQDGDFAVISGDSGSGKTTLLHMIGGIESPTSGEILINGKNIESKKNLMEFLKYEVAFLFQNFALVDSKTVEQNLELIPKESRSGISCEVALQYVGLEDKQKVHVYKLSGGEQQRVALARILMKKCNIILADEPTGSLDKRNADAVIELLVRMNSEGKTIVMVTHMEEYKAIGNWRIDL